MGLDNPIHLALLLMILLLVFGAKRLPEMGRSLGSGLRGFKESINGETPTDTASLISAATTPEQTTASSQMPTEPAACERPQAASSTAPTA